MSSSTEQKEDPVMLISTKYIRQLTSDVTTVTTKSLFYVDLNDPDEYIIQKAKEELRETPEIVAQAFKELREFLAGEPNLYIPDDDDCFIKFLRPCKWYAKSAFVLMKRYFRFRQNYPHIYANLIPSHEKMAICSNLLCPLLNRNKDGGRVILLEGGKKWKPKDVSPDYFFRTLLLFLAIAMAEYKTQITGVHIIIDTEGLSLSHVTYLTPSFAKMLLEFLQKCLPLRLKSVHIVNQSILFNVAFAIFKPFIEEKIRKRIFFHGTNRESLMAHIDKKVLFKRHGGEIPDMDESFGTHLWQYMCNFDNVFEAINKFGYITNGNKK